MNASRSAEAIRSFQKAHRCAGTPPVDFSSRALQPLEVQQAVNRAKSLLEPGKLVEGAGEAVPALGYYETDGRRDGIIDTLKRPTTVSVRASEQRLELVERLGVLQAAVDSALTVQARNSVEKMLAHQLAAAHKAAMTLLWYFPGMESNPAPFRATPPALEMARLGNAAARLMEAFSTGCVVLQKLKTGGTQRVIVQHQQVVVAQDGRTLVVNNSPAVGRRGAAKRRSGKA